MTCGSTVPYLGTMPRLLSALMIAALVACEAGGPHKAPDTSEPPPTFDRTMPEQLLGEWYSPMEDGRTVFHEQWRRSGGGNLEGLGFVMSGNDTVFIEHLGILFTDSGTWYSALIPTQNDGVPVHFRRTEDHDSLVFVNPEHDFPQRISYAPRGDGTWSVSVRGTEQGEGRVERFHFRPRSEEGADLP